MVKCPCCERWFKDKRRLKIHIAEKHPTDLDKVADSIIYEMKRTSRSILSVLGSSRSTRRRGRKRKRR
ncbi:MAG: hypothetical protein DRN15_06200 [Thermoprotei archaeon]|nr:MAG: hypothetical protein DRN15_06200 [Thermoprotei archaeon]